MRACVSARREAYSFPALSASLNPRLSRAASFFLFLSLSLSLSLSLFLCPARTAVAALCLLSRTDATDAVRLTVYCLRGSHERARRCNYCKLLPQRERTFYCS